MLSSSFLSFKTEISKLAMQAALRPVAFVGAAELSVSVEEWASNVDAGEVIFMSRKSQSIQSWLCECQK